MACVLLLVAQVISGWHLLHSVGLYTAVAARKYVWANAAVTLATAAAAIALPARWRWVAIIPSAAFVVVVIGATAIFGGQALGMLTALLTMAALFDTGERLLRRLGCGSLAKLVPVAWLAGIGPWALGMTLLGRLSLLRWWTAGVLVVVFGTIGCVRLAAMLLRHRRAVAGRLAASPVNAACGAWVLLSCGWAAIYTAAPEIQYDALYAKAYLPELWARTGHIGSLVQHVQFEITGWFQLLATSGHLLDGPSVGRYMQLIGLACAATTFWWWGDRHGALGPIAAAVVATTPQLFWQATTAYDDLLLALCALAFCIAIVESLRSETGETRRVSGLAFALGLMAGSGPSLKLHLTVLFGFLLIGWIASGHSSGTVRRRLAYSSLGAAITALPPLVIRWVESGNPVLPAYNNIFRSRYWLPVNEQMNFPFWPHPGFFGPITAVWKAVVEPQLMIEVAPAGAFGFLVGAVVIAIILGWTGRDRTRATRIVWLALLPSIVFWWVSLRYLRYLLPICFVSIALILMVARGIKLRRSLQIPIVLAAALGIIASFPVTIAQMWNVPTHKPPVYAAIGRWKAASYEEDTLTERPAMLAFDRLSPPGARLATTAFERGWLNQGRELYNLGYEVTPLMEIHGLYPKTGSQAFAALRRVGIDWILINTTEPTNSKPAYLWQVLAANGKLEYSARAWDLYRLVAR